MFDNVYASKAERNSFKPRAPHGAFIRSGQSPNGSALSGARAHGDAPLIVLLTRSSEKHLSSAKNTNVKFKPV